MQDDNKNAAAYWSANLRLITFCMSVWALVSYGFGILLRPLLSGISVGGTDLGFWFAQQGVDSYVYRIDLLLCMENEQTR